MKIKHFPIHNINLHCDRIVSHRERKKKIGFRGCNLACGFATFAKLFQLKNFCVFNNIYPAQIYCGGQINNFLHFQNSKPHCFPHPHPPLFSNPPTFTMK